MIVKCTKCGSKSLKAELLKDDDEEFRWLHLTCKKCNNTLFYNGA